MTDYRFVMGLLLQGYAYRQIEAMAGCSHRAIARARRVLDEEGFTTREQVDGLDGAHRNSPELLIGIPQVAWSG